MKFNKKLAFISGTIGWAGLGFIRGANYYNYYYIKSDKKENYLYAKSFLNGCFGVILYINPIIFPLLLYKEIYRLEVNIRNLEEEKKNNYYNDLL